MVDIQTEGLKIIIAGYNDAVMDDALANPYGHKAIQVNALDKSSSKLDRVQGLHVYVSTSNVHSNVALEHPAAVMEGTLDGKMRTKPMSKEKASKREVSSEIGRPHW
tara:strand:+ start:458 stop:778 length:321 start_codon:yes stop_codon:yes gene_type:complete